VQKRLGHGIAVACFHPLWSGLLQNLSSFHLVKKLTGYVDKEIAFTHNYSLMVFCGIAIGITPL